MGSILFLAFEITVPLVTVALGIVIAYYGRRVVAWFGTLAAVGVWAAALTLLVTSATAESITSTTWFVAVAAQLAATGALGWVARRAPHRVGRAPDTGPDVSSAH